MDFFEQAPFDGRSQKPREDMDPLIRRRRMIYVARLGQDLPRSEFRRKSATAFSITFHPMLESKHYTLHDFADEKRSALNRWALVVEAIVTGASAAVVPISAAKR